MSYPDVVQWLAFGIGTVGSVLWAQNGFWSKYAGAFWVVGSLLWMWYASLSGAPALAARDLVAVLTALWGTRRWMFAAKAAAPGS